MRPSEPSSTDDSPAEPKVSLPPMARGRGRGRAGGEEKAGSLHPGKHKIDMYMYSGEYVEFDLDAKFGVIANTKHALYGLVHAGSGE